jgi:hypothetical protein
MMDPSWLMILTHLPTFSPALSIPWKGFNFKLILVLLLVLVLVE